MNFYFQHVDPRAIDLSRATDDADGLTNLQEFRGWPNPTSAAIWTLLADQVSATSTSTQIIDSGAGSLLQRFYRASI